MAIKQLPPEKVASMSLEEKDAWWLANVYRGDMPQLTWRSAITGMLLGSLLSLTNLYIGARTGWALGVGLTSVIVSFGLFKAMAKVGLGREMTVLENNAMQSIATSAGYNVSPLYTSLAAYSMVTLTIVPMGKVAIWLFVVAILGVLFAFPMKKRFINDEQLPFPEGTAAGVVMDALHEGEGEDGVFKARLLAAAAAISAFVELIRDKLVMRAIFGLKSFPEYYDEVLYEGRFAEWLRAKAMVPKILGTELRELTLRWDTSLILLGTGGLTGIKNGTSLLIGGLLNYAILAPWLIQAGIIVPKAGHYGFRQITVWALWGGVACMTTASLYAFFSKPKVILGALRGLFGKKGQPTRDVLAHLELPTKLSLIGVPIVGALVVVLAHAWFGIAYWLGALAIPLVFVFTLIAVNSTALTGLTPSGALGKLTQLTYGVLAPANITTNLMTAGITAEVASNASNLLADIKPGYLLGAKPRQQAIGHVLGAAAGLVLAVPVWYFVFVKGEIARYGSDALPVPAALAWKSVAELLMKGLDNLHPSARAAVVVGATIGLVVEISKQLTRNRFPLSAVGLGLAFVISFKDVWLIFLGSVIFWALERRSKRWEERATIAPPPAEAPKPWWVRAGKNTEALCAGIVAGGALMGILVNVLDVLVLTDVAGVKTLAPAVKSALSKLPPR